MFSKMWSLGFGNCCSSECQKLFVRQHIITFSGIISCSRYIFVVDSCPIWWSSFSFGITFHRHGRSFMLRSMSNRMAKFSLKAHLQIFEKSP